MASRSCLYTFIDLLLLVQFLSIRSVKGNDLPPPHDQCRRVNLGTGAELIQFSLNLFYLETTLFLYASTGKGIDAVAPDLVQGPLPIGVRIANLDNITRIIIEEFGLQGVGIIRAILNTKLVDPIKMPLVNLSVEEMEHFVHLALNATVLTPPFNAYANKLNFLPTSASITSLIRQYYVGILPHLANNNDLQLATSILGTVSARFGVFRTLLYQIADVTMSPYPFNVATLVDGIAKLINRHGLCGVKRRLIVALELGAEKRSSINLIPGDVNSLAFSRTEVEILRIVYGTGNATLPAGLFPRGVNGKIAEAIARGRLG
ncbi:hypothetical protein CCACVL1_22272 [Corchorus capsularis]|uniref:Desiccation-related protein PCC13-62-like protein n=1 Tax=Corchorus capsularis TaxID=210143 RepID=A0A1R3H0A9_COCAP|nr:hypothetical protein CCACVL1_22272 [Corchorus capsularis]